MSEFLAALWALTKAIPQILQLIKWFNHVTGGDMAGAIQRAQGAHQALITAKTDEEYLDAAKKIQSSFANQRF